MKKVEGEEERGGVNYVCGTDDEKKSDGREL